jgi:hypothetical protein
MFRNKLGLKKSDKMKKTLQIMLNKFINSCKKTTELIDKKDISKLSLIEKIQLQLHLQMCNTCHAYEKRSMFLDNAIGKLFNQKQPHDKAHLSKDRKAKILEELKKN